MYRRSYSKRSSHWVKVFANCACLFSIVSIFCISVPHSRALNKSADTSLSDIEKLLIHVNARQCHAWARDVAKSTLRLGDSLCAMYAFRTSVTRIDSKAENHPRAHCCRETETMWGRTFITGTNSFDSQCTMSLWHHR